MEIRNFVSKKLPSPLQIAAVLVRIPGEAARLYRSYPLMITAIMAGLAVCSLLGVAILQEQEIKETQIVAAKPLPKAVSVPSPNRDPRPKYGYVNTIVIHVLTELTSAEYNLKIQNPRSRFSVHYSIAPDGTLFSHVQENDRAWHTPLGWLPDGNTHVNAFSVSVGLLVSPLSPIGENEGQLATLKTLLHQLNKRYVINWIATESQVSRDVRTDYDDSGFPFRQLMEFEDKFIFPQPGMIDTRKSK